MARVKYPLTEEAKEAARKAVIEQLGNGLQPLANTAAAIQAVYMLSYFIYSNKLF
jgi:hypothetical protein